jgi:death-on-curing protein
MRYLSAQEILILHALVIDETSGSHGVRNVGLLQSIVAKPRASFGGKDLYKGVLTKAAILLEAVVNYHVFVDGNKRTGLIVVARFLALNGYTLTATNKELERFALAVATKTIDMEEIIEWLKKNTKRAK